MNYGRTFEQKDDRLKRIMQYWQEVDEENDYYAATQQLKLFGGGNNGKPKEKTKEEINQDAVKDFIKECQQTMRRLKKAKATKKELDSLKELVDLYKQYFKSHNSNFDWKSDDALKQFKRNVVNESVQETIKEDFFNLSKKFPEEERMLNFMVNWIDWSEVEILPSRLAEIPMPQVIPEIQEIKWTPDPFYYSRRIEDRNNWWDMKVEDIITKKLGLEYKLVEKEFLKPHGRHVDFKAWMKKSIITRDWTDYDDPVPDIFEINVEKKEEMDGGKIKEIPYIEAYSFEQAFAEAGRLGLVRNAGQPFYWVHKISGKKEKFRYNFSSNEAFKNYLYAKDKISLGIDDYSKEWFTKDIYDELLAAAGERGKAHYETIMKKTAWSDRMLSNAAVLLISMAQESFFQLKKDEFENLRKSTDRTNGVRKLGHYVGEDQYKPTGLLYDEFLHWIYDYREEKRRMELQRKKEADDKKAYEDNLLYHIGEHITGVYYRYVRDGRELEVNKTHLDKLRKYIADEDYYGIRVICGEYNPDIKEQQDLYYMLTWDQRKVVLDAYSRCWMLYEVQELEVVRIMENTPPDQQGQLKIELKKSNKKLYKSLKSLCENYNTRREFYFVTEQILDEPDWSQIYDLKTESAEYNVYDIIQMTPRQIAVLTNDEYRKELDELVQKIYYGDYFQRAIVDLIIYASSSQQKVVQDILTANNMKVLIDIKRTMGDTYFKRLMNGETVANEVATAQRKDPIQRGHGLNDILLTSETFVTKIRGMLKSYTSYSNVDNNELILAMVPESVIRKLSDDERANMILYIANGSYDDGMDEETILRILNVVIEEKDETGRQEFYYKIKNNTALKKIRYGVGGDNYAELEVLLSKLNPAGRSSRISTADNAGYFEADTKIGYLEEGDMEALSFEKRTGYIDEMVGSSKFEQDFTRVGTADEKTINRLINSTPVNQVERLQQWLINQNGERYQALENAMHGAEYKDFHAKLQAITEKQMISVAEKDPEQLKEYYKEYRQMELVGQHHKNGVVFSNPGALQTVFGNPSYIYDVFFFQNQVVINWRREFTLSSETKIFDPWELVVVEHLMDDADLNVRKGDKVVMPAIGLFYLENKQDVQNFFEVLDVALLFVGVGELKMAGSLLARVIAITDITLAVGNLVINNYGHLMPDDFKKAWQELNNLFVGYMVLRLGVAGIKKGRDLVKKLKDKIKKLPKAKQDEVLADLNAKEQGLNDAEDILNKNLEELEAFRRRVIASNMDQVSRDGLVEELNKLIEAKSNQKFTDDLAQKLQDDEILKKKKADDELKSQENDNLDNTNGDEFKGGDEGGETVVDDVVEDGVKTADDAVDMATYSADEIIALQNFRTRFPGVICGDTEIIQLFRKTDSIAQFDDFLLATNGDVTRLNKVIDIAGGAGSASKLERLIGIARDDISRFNAICDEIHKFEKLPVPSSLSYPENIYHYDNVDMPHFLTRHTFEYFDFSKNITASKTTFWPKGTTPDQIKESFQEALDLLHAEVPPRLPIANVPERVVLSNGREVQVGARTPEGATYVEIGQFYPAEASDLITFNRREMKAIQKIKE